MEAHHRPPPTHDYQLVVDLLHREPLRNERLSQLHWWSHSLMQELAPSGIDFSSNDLKVEGRFDFDMEWGTEHGRPARGDLCTCPLSNLLYEPSQTSGLRLSTLVQYFRVIKRTQPLSRKVQGLMEEAAELERNPLPTAMSTRSPENFVAVSVRRVNEDAERATSPIARSVEGVVSALVDDSGSSSFARAKELVDIVTRAIFGSRNSSEHTILQRVLLHIRFLNYEIPVYERVALNCARVVLKEKAAEVFAHSVGNKEPARLKSRTRKARRSTSPKQRDMLHNPFMPTKFVNNAERVSAEDLLLPSKSSPATISRYLKKGSFSDVLSDPSSVWTPPGISFGRAVADIKCGRCRHSSVTCTASMNWKLDELLQMRKMCKDLTEERDKAVELYTEAVGQRKKAQKDCKDATDEYAHVEALLPVMLEGIQDVTSVVTSADAEARAQWRQIHSIDKISRDMLENLDRVFAECKHVSGERAQLSDDLFVTGKKLRKYRSKLDSARNTNSHLTVRLAETSERLNGSEYERRRAQHKHAAAAQTQADASRLEISTLFAEHYTLVAGLKDGHSTFAATQQQQHAESAEQLEALRVKQVSDLEAQRAQEVAGKTVCCSVLQCVAVCCSVLQHVTGMTTHQIATL